MMPTFVNWYSKKQPYENSVIIISKYVFDNPWQHYASNFMQKKLAEYVIILQSNCFLFSWVV